MSKSLLALLTLLCLATRLSTAGPPTREEMDRRAAALEQLKQSVAAEPAPEKKLALFQRALAAETVADARTRILDLSADLPAPHRETLLTNLLANDLDAGVRSNAATTLGKTASERALAALATAAANDPTTDLLMGDVGGRSSARRAATFAIAELAARHPALAKDAAAKLKALPANAPPPDNEGLVDARAQALYQITRDDTLLKPFRDRLKSNTASDRQSGVVAFRFLNLKQAPPEVTNALKDPDPGVRSWAALVLGEIADPKSTETLMTLAADPTEQIGPRVNAIYSLGRMRAPTATPLIEKLLTDPDPRIPPSAAIAFYRITGKKTPQFPEGYNAD